MAQPATKEALASIGVLLLDRDASYTLQAEKVLNRWNLELIDRATGMTWIIYCDTKAHAQKCFNGMSLSECREWMHRMQVEPVQMYKKGVM